MNIIRNSKIQSHHPEDLLVGDIIEISDGNVIPADGILISGDNVEVDESAITGENEKLKKVSSAAAEKLKEEYMLQHPDLKIDGPKYIYELPSPICISGTTIAEGRGRMLVVAVGQNST